MGACADVACTYGEGGRCRLAASLPPGQACPNLGGIPADPVGGGATGSESPEPTPGTEPPAPEAASAAEPYTGAFWSGTALGMDDLWRFQLGPDPRLLLVAGSEDAGKTCLLVGMWVALANGPLRGSDNVWRFLGSESLRGWRNLSDPAYDWKGDRDRILPRTSITDLRQPSFLHLRVSRDWGEHLSDLLLSDLPGEWFEAWARSAPEGARRIPILPAVRGALLVVDTPKLLTDREYMYEAENQARRLAEGCAGRPVAVALTKCDEAVVREHLHDVEDPKTWTARARNRLPAVVEPLSRARYRVFRTAAFVGRLDEHAPEGVLEPLRWLLDETAPRPSPAPEPSPPSGPHPFGWMREPAAEAR